MITGKRSLGMKKHGQSGPSGPSPKARLVIKMEAEKDERKAKRHPMAGSIKELFDK